MSKLWEWGKVLARAVWFREGSVRRVWIGPYSGLRFVLCPQMLVNRMCVFYSAYEAEVTEFLTAALLPGMVAYNSGAHVGIHALFMAKRVGREGTVCAFEPWPSNLECLERNIGLNRGRVGKVIPVAKAVCDRDGLISMTQGRSDGTHHLTGPEEAVSVQVQATTLDSFATETGLDPDLILVDVEGAEIAVLKGAMSLIRRARPDLLLEHHGVAYHTALKEILTAEGYGISSVGSRHLLARHPDRGSS
jgi:FkbM family methyltransferase